MGTGKSNYIRDLVTLALFTALLFVLQVVLAPLPNVELVSLLIVLYTRHYGFQTLLVIYAFALMEGMFYGFGMWFLNYLYVWTVLWGLVMLMKGLKGALAHAVLLTFYGLSFGTLCSFPYLVIGGLPMMGSYIVSGIPFDLMHGISNGVLCLVLYHPLQRLFLMFLGEKRN